MSLKVSLNLLPTDKGGRSSPIQITHDPRNALAVQLRTADGRSVDVNFMTAIAPNVEALMPGESYDVSFYTREPVEALDELVGVHVDVLESEQVIGDGMIFGVFGWLGDPWKKIGEEQRRRRENK